MILTNIVNKLKNFYTSRIVPILQKIKIWFNKNHKYIIYGLIIIVGITIAHSLLHKPNQIPSPITVVDYKQVQSWKDKYNNEHNKLVQTQLTSNIFKHQADSIADLLKVKPVNIQSVTSVTTRSEINSEPETVYVDSTKTYNFYDSTNYYRLSGILDTKTNNSKFNLSTYDTLTVVPYTKHTFFKETFNVDITNRNPYNHIVSGYSYSQQQKIKRWGLGPNIIYDPIRNQVAVGIGLQYNIIRF